MPYRRIVFANNQIYHVFNRGVANSTIFINKKDYHRFINLLNYYRFSNSKICFSHQGRNPKVGISKKSLDAEVLQIEILAYCLMPNHFHLLLRQVSDNGISSSLTKIQNSYAKYFNIKNIRRGPLFQSMFKAVLITSDEELLHVSRYIHLNPCTSLLVKINNLKSYPWSSFPQYLANFSGDSDIFVKTDLILALANGRRNYEKFVFEQAEYQQELHRIKDLILENPTPGVGLI